MGIQLRARGVAHGLPGRVLGRVTRVPVEASVRGDHLRVVAKDSSPSDSLVGYAAVLFEGSHTQEVDGASVTGYSSLDFLHDGYVVAVDTGNGFTRVLYRTESQHNVIFATDRCNSNCLMCSQPPKDVDDSERVAEHLRLIDLIPNQPETLGITGGEPALLKDGLVEIIARLKARFPETAVTMLSNGRLYAYEDYVEKLADVGHPHFLTSHPALRQQRDRPRLRGSGCWSV